MADLPIPLDRAGKTPLAAQIYRAIRDAIETGRLASDARLPSWRDLAAQLGVSRGTVRVAYERLINEQFVVGLAGMTVAPVPVDEEGLDVAAGVRSAADAALAVVTPGQQAPLGMTMSLQRRLALLAWARKNDGWVIEDDYLSELQLKGRAAPALASLDHGGRVLHIGTFSKTISPALRLGFLVVPSDLARQFGDLAACLAPAPNAAVQRAVADFLREGHYLRHLRRMKRHYAARRELLLRCLREVASNALRVEATAGLAVVTLLPESASDVDAALRALQFGLAPAPLSPWYAQSPARKGLLLGVTNVNERRLPADCRRLAELAR